MGNPYADHVHCLRCEGWQAQVSELLSRVRELEAELAAAKESAEEWKSVAWKRIDAETSACMKHLEAEKAGHADETPGPLTLAGFINELPAGTRVTFEV